MRITNVEVFPLGKPYPEFQGALVRVNTDEGVSGWGSCTTTGGLLRASLDAFSYLIKGENALEPERVTEKLHQETHWYRQSGVVSSFISGMNIALWDILGKATSQSVSRLLGGRYREKMKPYASQLFTWPVDEMVEQLQAAKTTGFRAFKLGWGRFGLIDDRADEAMVKAAREAIGEECDLMVDAGGHGAFWPNGLKWAINTSHMLKEYNVLWFEEALPDNDLEGHRALTQVSPVWIATGECLRKRESFYPWIFQRAVDVLQPDLTIVGGISEGRRIAWAANDHGILVVCHGWNTGVGLAADLQLNAAISQARFVEYWTPAPYIDGILTKPFHLDDEGMLQIPDSPGLGIEVDVEALSKFAP